MWPCYGTNAHVSVMDASSKRHYVGLDGTPRGALGSGKRVGRGSCTMFDKSSGSDTRSGHRAHARFVADARRDVRILRYGTLPVWLGASGLRKGVIHWHWYVLRASRAYCTLSHVAAYATC
jgi:hypothetical protein